MAARKFLCWNCKHNGKLKLVAGRYVCSKCKKEPKKVYCQNCGRKIWASDGTWIHNTYVRCTPQPYICYDEYNGGSYTYGGVSSGYHNPRLLTSNPPTYNWCACDYEGKPVLNCTCETYKKERDRLIDKRNAAIHRDEEIKRKKRDKVLAKFEKLGIRLPII